MFPAGGPGAALLLLRLSVAATLVLDVAGHAAPLEFWGALLLVALLCIGFATPVASVLACVFQVAVFAMGPANGRVLVPALDAVALALLGPGAWSVDARMFGRRVIVLPPRDK